jgi:hypothetical protein
MLACALLPYPRVAAAEDPPNLPQCAEAFEKAQMLSKQGKLTPALEQLLICAQSSCPPFLAKECTANYDRIKTSLPTVTLIARRSEAEPLVDVKVSVDGKPLVSRIDGLSVPVDPGVHEFVFEHEGDAPVSVRVLLAEGEKNKPVVAEFYVPPPAAPVTKEPAAPPKPVAAPPQERQGFRIPAAAYVLGGVGLAGVGVGITFRVLGAADYNELAETCGHRCADADVDAAKRKYLISHIGLGVGAAALVATGVVIYFGQDRASEPTRTATGFRAVPVLLDGNTPGAIVSGDF